MPTMSSRWLLLFALPVLLRLLKTRRGPSREKIILPREERVVLLGASSGVGKDLALAYAKRGAKICIFARRKSSLEAVKAECLALGLSEDKIILVTGDVTSVKDLVKLRETVVEAWGGLDTLHILAGVPSTSTLMQLAGVQLEPASGAQSKKNPSQRFVFTSEQGQLGEAGPGEEGLERLAAEARACAEVNYVGTVLALGAFVPLLASSSRSPALHHLSSVAATIPAPCRAIYSATKAAGLMAMESCRVECEGSGIRFFSLLPGTIANDFRTKTATSDTGGRDETKLDIKGAWGEKLLLPPAKVVDTIFEHLALPPSPYPLIPYPPFSWISALSHPPRAIRFLPFMYRAATWMRDTPLGWAYVEPSARKKYGLPN
ncbi:uncharacterized protein MKK02DRAFT_33954 [Dioszegia hungarica]|uniref:NAD(P)-binding protein n=1 Tax=Dioszegia hungarica TaxID=4972 RepID=A0AA38LX04_9TREE|nr:uncharacterized protein MKK02DRAFT_33954 [Dioszegia hungarica]KAI9636856.1 hypothetical protein MKK02DRAFT_33954 [Dioszegia hungarica]